MVTHHDSALATRTAADGTTPPTFSRTLFRVAPSLRPYGLRQLSPVGTAHAQWFVGEVQIGNLGLLSRYATVKRKILGAQRCLWMWLRNATRGHGGEKKKQQGVGGNVQVEIHHAV
jgi:hypothetical protein